MITACVTVGREEDAQHLLQEAIDGGVFEATLGYDKQENKLNFHRNTMEVLKVDYAHEPAVPATVAQVIFRRHYADRNINQRTEFVVGHHGDNKIKESIEECIRACGWIPVPTSNPGRIAIGSNQ